MANISQEQVEKDLTLLSETDIPYAMDKVDVERKEYVYKKTKQLMFLESSGTVAERTAKAETHHKTQKAHDEYIDAVTRALELENSRKTAQLRIDVWRSVNANRRQGHV